MEITKQQYEYSLNRIEELLPLVTDETPIGDKNAVELTIVSDVVEAYEKNIIPLPNLLLENQIRYFQMKLCGKYIVM